MEPVDENMIFKVLAGEACKEELEAFEQWLSASPHHKEKFLLYQGYWRRKKAASRDTKEQVWQKVSGKLGLTDHPIKEAREKQVLISRPFWVAAVSFLVLLIAGMGVYWGLQKTNGAAERDGEMVSYLEKTTQEGQKSSLTLPDGSLVKLNSNSRIRFVKNFGKQNREVFLQGEAFFDVVQDTLRPFVIHSGNVITRVLGTSFNIRSVLSEKKISIAVLTGKVEVSSPDDGLKVHLIPKEMGVFDRSKSTIEKRHFDPDKVVGWKDGVLWFERNNLSEVLKELENWYGVTFEVGSGVKVAETYTGRFDNQYLENVLEGMAFTFRFDFKIAGDTVKLTKKKRQGP